MDFGQADEKFKQLKARYKAGELTEAEFKSQLQDLMVQDEGGAWWMIGYETGQWYVHDGQHWYRDAYRPGDIAAAHQPDEWIAEAEEGRAVLRGRWEEDPSDEERLRIVEEAIPHVERQLALVRGRQATLDEFARELETKLRRLRQRRSRRDHRIQ